MNNEELVKQYQSGDKKVLDKLIQANTGIINKIANKYNGINRELEVDDLFQNGVLGLIKAVEKYNPNHEKKAKFITYAVHYINRYIHSSVNGLSSKDIGNIEFHKNCTSLNIPVGENAAEEIICFVEDVDYSFENIEEKIFLSNLKNELEKAMQDHNTLEQREILKYRYGWNTKPMTLNDIANIFDITCDKVRNIESMALRKLRLSKWVRENAGGFAELGYINSFYLNIFRNYGIKV